MLEQRVLQDLNKNAHHNGGCWSCSHSNSHQDISITRMGIHLLLAFYHAVLTLMI